ncbi:MAG TPA: hypothetical protein VGI63_02220 [Verrucomicrobiae bacterium]
MNQCAQPPSAFVGVWFDTGFLGGNGGAWPLDVNILIRWLLGPLGYSKFLPPVALLILGLCAWTFFRQLKLTPLAATLGGLAAMLNSTFFSTACWGVAGQQIAFGIDFLALALIVSNTRETVWHIRWIRLALAGLCVGINVMESADIGALFSLLIAAFVFVKALADDPDPVLKRVARGVGHLAVVAIFAGFVALQTVLSLVSTQIQGVTGTAQNVESKAAHWDFATQWSLPKVETFGLIVPGLFGYKMDTPKDMPPSLHDAYRNGLYWGGVGRDPVNDRYFDSGGEGNPPNPGWMRFTGGGNYCGILVLLIAAWGAAQSFRRQNSPFPDAQKRMIWFWLFVALISLPIAWGRFAPFSKTSDSMMFYALLYKLPYFSTIRNPTKFLFILSWAVVILFGYGVHALNRRYLDPKASLAAGLGAQWKIWWSKAGGFDRKWTYAMAGLFGAGVAAWLIYSAQKPELVQHLQKVGFPDSDPSHDNSAASIAAFSIGQLGYFLFLLAGAIALLLVALTGYFNGPRAKIGAVLLGSFLILDLGRANLPWIVHWDYKQKYEVGALNPVVDFLRNKPYEHRVAKLLPPPLSTPSQFELFDQLYEIEWKQHHFLYYNIQSLDIIQMPREPEDMTAYLGAIHIGVKQDASGHWMLDQATFPQLTRKWELTNTRYLLGPAAFIDLFNAQFDPGKNRFHIVQKFSVLPKPGIAQPTRLEELTAVPSDNGDYALFEFTGALPRAKLYSNWQVNTNDQSVLNMLADPNFDPAKTVLISTPQKNLPAISTNENSGTVEFKSYAPKKIVFTATATAPSVLLLNDKYDPNWRVTVDGRPAELLRCNFIMRGVQVPAGAHAVEFDFSLSSKMLYVTLSAYGVGLLLCGCLAVLTRRKTGTDA